MRTFTATALFAATAAISTIAAPAFAQDVPPPPFGGGKIEIIGGVDRTRANGSGETGALYGIAGGYDFQTLSGTVFGIEAEASDSTADDCVGGVVRAGDSLCAKAKRDLYAGGRVGFTSGSTLIYGKAGYSNFRVGADYDDGTAAGLGDFRQSRNLDGVRVGAGLEKNIGNFAVKAEYRYSNYEDGVSKHQGVVGAGIRF